MRTSFEIVTALCNAADAMSAPGCNVNISDAALRQLKDEIRHASLHTSDNGIPIDYEARCLVDCLAELAYARTDGDGQREERALFHVNRFREFVRGDLNRAARRAVTG